MWTRCNVNCGCAGNSLCFTFSLHTRCTTPKLVTAKEWVNWLRCFSCTWMKRLHPTYSHVSMTVITCTQCYHSGTVSSPVWFTWSVSCRHHFYCPATSVYDTFAVCCNVSESRCWLLLGQFLVLLIVHTYMKFITRCIVEDGSNQRCGLLLGGGV